MAAVKALFPVWKTWWAKWNDTQRVAFNEARAAGVPFLEAAAIASKAVAAPAPVSAAVLDGATEAAVETPKPRKPRTKKV